MASATGMYLTFFTTLAASINLLINNKLNIPYSITINILTIIGTIPGLYGQLWIVKKAGGRSSMTVAILLFFIVFQLVTILPLSSIEAKRAADDGEEITAFKQFCE